MSRLWRVLAGLLILLVVTGPVLLPSLRALGRALTIWWRLRRASSVPSPGDRPRARDIQSPH